jgi:hypothetical protein
VGERGTTGREAQYRERRAERAVGELHGGIPPAVEPRMATGRIVAKGVPETAFSGELPGRGSGRSSKMMRAVMSPAWNAAKEAIPVGERDLLHDTKAVAIGSPRVATA